MKTNAFRISICVNLALFAFFGWYFIIHVGAEVYYRKYISPREMFFEDIYYRAKVQAYTELNERLDPEDSYNVFIGDSVIEQFPVNEVFPCANAVNRGIGMDTTVGVLERLHGNVNNIKVANAFLMIGYNDLKYRTVEETVRNIEIILTALKAEKRYFISILPCKDAEYNAKIKQINEKIERLSLRGEFEYVDCFQLFVDSDGKPKVQYYYDGVHLRLGGYLKIKDSIRKFITR